VDCVDDSYYMQIALEESKKAFAAGEVPIGAVIVLNGEVIAQAHNLKETWLDPTAHAEMVAIREACKKLNRWRLTGATLYVTLEPCPMCAGAIVQSRIDRLVYGVKDPKAGAVDSLFNMLQNDALNHQLVVKSGVLAEECSQILKDFFQKKR
jgi:tRNA(adenine34) deaminase